MSGSVTRLEDGRCIVPDALRTENMLERMRGLLARPALQSGQGLLIEPCSAVHALGMTYALDLVFLSAAGRILKLVRALLPWHMAACGSARMVLELPAGSITALELAEGQTLNWVGP